MLVPAVKNFLCQHEVKKRVWVAYSGGLDSHVLLDICVRLRDELSLQLCVIHINHGLSKASLSWAKHCETICHQYGVDYHCETIQIDRRDESLEEVARNKRYAIFADRLDEADILLTAHHQDDQAETVLLQLLRGAGVKGLAAMPAKKLLGRGVLGRPLLAFTREDILAYAKTVNLHWIEDESNQNQDLSRNYLRYQVMPLLKEHWPSAAKTISRTALHCAEVEALLEDRLASTLKELSGSQTNTLSISKLSLLNVVEQKRLLRSFIAKNHFLMPSAKKMMSIINNVLHSAYDKMPCVTFGNVECRRYGDDLYLLPVASIHDATQSYVWDLTSPLSLPGVGTVSARLVEGDGIRADIKSVTLRFRQGGEKVVYPGRGRCTLKNLFQEWRIPPWIRDRIPLVYIDEQLVAICGYFIHPEFVAKEFGYQLTVTP